MRKPELETADGRSESENKEARLAIWRNKSGRIFGRPKWPKMDSLAGNIRKNRRNFVVHGGPSTISPLWGSGIGDNPQSQ